MQTHRKRTDPRFDRRPADETRRTQWRELRERLGMTQAQVATRLGLDITTVWRLETDQRYADRIRAAYRTIYYTLAAERGITP